MQHGCWCRICRHTQRWPQRGVREAWQGKEEEKVRVGQRCAWVRQGHRVEQFMERFKRTAYSFINGQTKTIDWLVGCLLAWLVGWCWILLNVIPEKEVLSNTKGVALFNFWTLCFVNRISWNRSFLTCSNLVTLDQHLLCKFSPNLVRSITRLP